LHFRNFETQNHNTDIVRVGELFAMATLSSRFEMIRNQVYLSLALLLAADSGSSSLATFV